MFSCELFLLLLFTWRSLLSFQVLTTMYYSDLKHISYYTELLMKTKPFAYYVEQESRPAAPHLHAYSMNRPRPTLHCDPSEDRTDQSFAQECDINYIMKQYEEIGVVDHLQRLQPQWGEVPNFDFRTSMEMIREAREKFEALPATLRERFSNDPHNFMEFFQREENRDEGERLGVLVKRERAQPLAPSVAPPPPPSTEQGLTQ